MTNQQFSISYNGRKTSVTTLEDNTFMVQITYKPYRIQKKTDGKGLEYWIELETNKETPLSQTIGRLISSQTSG